MAREGHGPDTDQALREIYARPKPPPKHDCWENFVYTENDGALGQAYICGLCGELLQVG